MSDIKVKRLSPLKSIKAHCRDECCSGDRDSWQNCDINDCLLWDYRFGKNPNSKRKGNPNALINYHKNNVK